MMEFNKNDFVWCEVPIIGNSLLFQGGEVDSNQDKLIKSKFYDVGKHKLNGGIIIMPTVKRLNQKEFVKEFLRKEKYLN